MNFKQFVKYGLGGILTILLLSMILAPRLIKIYVNNNGKELTGRALHMNKLRVNYFSSTVRIIGFSLFEQDDTTEFLGFDTLKVNLKPLRLLKDEFHIQQLLLANPRGIILQNDSVFNFSDLILESDTIEEEIADTGRIMPYRLNLNQLEMRNGNFTFTDVPLHHSIHLNKLSFIIPQIYWNSADSSKAGLAFDLSEGGHFESNMQYKVGTGKFRGNVDITGLELQTFLPYIQQQMNFSDIDGTFDTRLTFQGSSDALESLSIKGNVQVNNLALNDNEGRKVLGLDTLSVALKKLLPNRGYYEFEKIALSNPYVYFALIDSSTNFEKLLVASFDTTVTSNEVDSLSSELEMFVRLNQFDINNGLIDFSDRRLNNEFNYELSEVQLNMDTLDLVDDWVNLSGTMKLNKRGNLHAKLGLNPSNVMDSIQLDYVVSDFQLPDLNIYSKHYVGLPILFGDMYYVSKTSIVHNQLVSNNELIIRNVDMGRKTGGLYDVPIKLAMFILKDINGDINLDIPVKGDLNDPETKMGPIVFNTLKNFIFKIVASPFKALGGLLGANPDDIREIVFDYGDTTLTNRHIKTVSLLLELEREKPELQTDLIYFNDKELEKLDAAREISHELYWVAKNKEATSNMKDYEKFLQKATGKDSLVLQDYEILLAPGIMVDSLVEQREDERIKMVADYLSSQSDSTRIRLIPFNQEEVLNKGSRPRFEVRVNLAEDME